MKHVIYTFCLLAFLLIALPGCNFIKQNIAAAPGEVLSLNQGGDNSQKIVTFDVIGKGLEPENALTKGSARIMAERSAVADGYRQLVEKVKGVYVDASMKAGFGKVNQEMITTKAQSWLRGVEVIEIRPAEYGIIEAHMRLRIYFSKKNMVWWPMGPDQV